MYHPEIGVRCAPGSVLILVLCLLGGPRLLAAPAAVEVCAVCHAADGLGVGERLVPIIAAMPAVHIEEAIYAYKDGARRCAFEPVMCEKAASLTDEEVADLAEYYSALPRKSLDQPFDPALAARGEKIHDALCSRCHVPPDHPNAQDRLGPPLHGQRAAYLEYALHAYFDGTRDNLLDEMKEKIGELKPGDVEALINYYASF